ncbi:hypothetical protein BH10PSE3_BH10PSE3_20810 [soil metagenome]
MSRHHPEILADVAANDDIGAALRAAKVELSRRRAYFELKTLERHLASFPPVPGDPAYAETFPDFADEFDKS